VQGGGSDLIFPHHDMSAGHAAALSGHPLAQVYSHTGMVAYQGEKMSKSLGNLVLVSRLRAGGTDPRAIRLALLAQHYRTDWEWTAQQLVDAEARLAAWTLAFGPVDTAPGTAVSAFVSATAVVERMRAALVDDLDTRGALDAVDEAVAAGVDDRALVAAAIDALLGVKL